MKQHRARRFYPIYPFGDHLMAVGKHRITMRSVAARVIFGKAVGFACVEHDTIARHKPPIQDIELLWKLSRESKKDIFYCPQLDHRLFVVRYVDVKAERERYERTYHEDPWTHNIQYQLSAQFAAVGLAGSGRPIIQNIYSYHRLTQQTPVQIEQLSVLIDPVKAGSNELLADMNPYYVPVETRDAIEKFFKRRSH